MLEVDIACRLGALNLDVAFAGTGGVTACSAARAPARRR